MVEIVNPHLGAQSGGLTPEPQVPLDQLSGEKLLRTVWLLYDKARGARKSLEPTWEEYQRAWRGDLRLKGERPKYYFNHISKITEHIVSSMTNGLFKIKVLPEGPEDEEVAETLENAANWTLKRMNPLVELQNFVRDGYIYGTVPSKIVWNPNLEQGLGNSEYRTLDIRRFYIDPDATSIHPSRDDALFLIHEVFADTNYIWRRYKKRVDADEDLLDRNFRTEFVSANRSTPLGVVSMPSVQGAPGHVITRRTRVIEVWVRDYVLAAYGFAIPKELRSRAKEPDWLVVTATRKDILEVKSNPYGRLPFVVWRPIPQTGHFHGFSELQNLLDPQLEYNERRTQLTEHAAFYAHPMGLVDPRARFDWRNIVVGPGKIYPLRGQFEFAQVPTIDSAVIQSAMQSLSDMEDISGVHDVARGQREPQITAGVAIQALQEKAELRVSSKRELLTDALSEQAELVILNIVNRWMVPRMVRLLGETKTQQFQRINLPKLLRAGKEVFQFDVQVEVARPETEKLIARQEALLLAQGDFIDQRALLDALEYPNREAIIARMEQKEQEQIALAQQLQQGPGGNGNAPPQPISPEEAIMNAEGIEDLPPEIGALIEWLQENLPEELGVAGNIVPMLRRELMAVEEAAE